MSGNDPNRTTVTQEALLEQLKRQHERICILETQLAEGRQATPPELTDGPVTLENELSPEAVEECIDECEEWPDPRPASLSQWVSYLADALFDRAETMPLSTAPNAPETVSASETDSYEPTLRLDSDRLHRAHRRLTAGQRRTGWRTALTLTSLGAAALAFVQWQQHPGRTFLPASAEMQASIESDESKPPQSDLSPASAAPTEVPTLRPAGSPATLRTRSAPATAPAPVKSVTAPASRLAQTKPTLRQQGHVKADFASARIRLASASTHAFRIATALPAHSAFARTSASEAAKRRTAHLQIATGVPMNAPIVKRHLRSQTRLASFSAWHPDPLDSESGSSRSAELSEQKTTEESPVATQAQPNSPDIFDRADKTLKNLSDLCDRIGRHRKNQKQTPQEPIRKSEIVHVAM